MSPDCAAIVGASHSIVLQRLSQMFYLKLHKYTDEQIWSTVAINYRTQGFSKQSTVPTTVWVPGGGGGGGRGYFPEC